MEESVNTKVDAHESVQNIVVGLGCIRGGIALVGKSASKGNFAKRPSG
jgi:hypothetical protein